MPLDDRKKKILEDLYYKDGLSFGRDALFDIVKKRYKKTPPLLSTSLSLSLSSGWGCVCVWGGGGGGGGAPIVWLTAREGAPARHEQALARHHHARGDIRAVGEKARRLGLARLQPHRATPRCRTWRWALWLAPQQLGCIHGCRFIIEHGCMLRRRPRAPERALLMS